VLTSVKGIKIVNSTAPPVSSAKYIGDVAIISFKSKFSGVQSLKCWEGLGTKGGRASAALAVQLVGLVIG